MEPLLTLADIAVIDINDADAAIHKVSHVVVIDRIVVPFLERKEVLLYVLPVVVNLYAAVFAKLAAKEAEGGVGV